jgi:hypothetical protein
VRRLICSTLDPDSQDVHEPPQPHRHVRPLWWQTHSDAYHTRYRYRMTFFAAEASEQLARAGDLALARSRSRAAAASLAENYAGPPGREDF